eukprot:3500640-Rhodomonas_salina.2
MLSVISAVHNLKLFDFHLCSGPRGQGFGSNPCGCRNKMKVSTLHPSFDSTQGWLLNGSASRYSFDPPHGSEEGFSASITDKIDTCRARKTVAASSLTEQCERWSSRSMDTSRLGGNKWEARLGTEPEGVQLSKHCGSRKIEPRSGHGYCLREERWLEFREHGDNSASVFRSGQGWCRGMVVLLSQDSYPSIHVWNTQGAFCHIWSGGDGHTDTESVLSHSGRGLSNVASRLSRTGRWHGGPRKGLVRGLTASVQGVHVTRKEQDEGVGLV